MSWIREEKSSWLHSVLVSTLRSGPIPRHVAFIMDGNRRFARRNNLEQAKGHILGFDKLTETLEWCLDLGITEVTVYAFSIENFKRSKEEVDGLMELARQKFKRLMEEKELIAKHEVCFRILGNISLLPLDIQQMIAEGIQMTKHNSRAILNICIAYTSRDEMCHAAEQLADGVSRGVILESDIDESLFEKCLYSSKSSPPDLLIRTSGESRLSDFLLWQSCYTPMSFMKVLWPDFSQWHLYAAVLYYQRQLPAIQKARAEHVAELDRRRFEADLACVNQALVSAPQALVSAPQALVSAPQVLVSAPRCDLSSSLDSPPLHKVDRLQEERVAEYRVERLKRVDKFLTCIDRNIELVLGKLLDSKRVLDAPAVPRNIVV